MDKPMNPTKLWQWVKYEFFMVLLNSNNINLDFFFLSFLIYFCNLVLRSEFMTISTFGEF